MKLHGYYPPINKDNGSFYNNIGAGRSPLRTEFVVIDAVKVSGRFFIFQISI